MATVIRNTDKTLSALVAAHNDLKAQVGAGSSYHLDASELSVSLASPTDLPTALTFLRQMSTVYKFMIADTLAHKVAGVDLTTYAPPTDLASAIAMANDIKAKYNTHIASTTYHYTADVTNAVAAANATILSDLLTLLIAEKAALNAHMASAPASHSLRLVSA